MTRIPGKARFVQTLQQERERLILALEREIAEAIRGDAELAQAVPVGLSADALRRSIQLVIALGKDQYFWFCFWRDGLGGAMAYDEEDCPDLKVCDQSTDDKDVAAILGFAESRVLYSERVKYAWLIQTEYTDAAAKPVAHALVAMYKETRAPTKQVRDTQTSAPQAPGAKGPDWKLVLAVVSAAVSVFMSPFFLDVDLGVIASLIALAVFALWWVWTISSLRRPYRVLSSLVIIVFGASWGSVVWWYSQPHFEITAFKTLEGDRNAYELTDQLIWNQDRLGEFRVGITFTLQVRPTYYGKQRFGKVIALIPGGGRQPPLEKPLWDDFSKESGTQWVELTLPELLAASGLRVNSDPPHNILGPGDLPFQQAKLLVQVVREGGRERAWGSEDILVRNAPWDMRSALVLRNGKREADVYVKNLGGTGEFTVRYRLVRLEKEIGSSALPMVSGATNIDAWNAPQKLEKCKSGSFFTATSTLPDQLPQGRYLLEIYVVKKQNYVEFQNPGASWENLNSLDSPWWFGQYPSDRHVFVVTTSEFDQDPVTQAEWQRLKNEQGIDLGIAVGPVQRTTSKTGASISRQAFQDGEIHVHDGRAYSLYGPILEHYRQLGGPERDGLETPISQIQDVTSSSNTDGNMMAFEGLGDPSPPSRIYVSGKGVGMLEGWIGAVYEENGGHVGWLGFPLVDRQYTADSTIQMFEYGYIVYYYPKVGDDRDWSRKPKAYPYLAGRGNLIDVQANQPWQDTGIEVQKGDLVTIVQVGGTWSNDSSVEQFDANGNPASGLRDYRTMASAVGGMLIGRIGGNEQPFTVGRWNTLSSPVAGHLYLAMNDSEYSDNKGSVTVQIIVEHSG